VQPATFFLPGPTQVREDVLRAMLRQPIPHRGAEFHEIFSRIQSGMRDVFRTQRQVYVLTSSGTGGMEAAIRCAPRGRILALVNGAFGERFVRLAHVCGREVDKLDVALGDVPDPAEVSMRLSSGSYSALTMVHNESSTGALADVRAISRVAREAGVATIVDSVSGVAGARLEFDAWEVDCVVSASQKALALPTGLAFAVVSERYLRAIEQVDDRGMYFDLLQYESHGSNNETPITPAVSLIFALDRQVQSITSEGMDARWARHEAMRLTMEQWVDTTRDALDMEIAIFAKVGARSPTVTAVSLPAGVMSGDLVRKVSERGYTIGAGYGVLRSGTFRVGHMGDHTVAGLESCLGAIADGLKASRS
jgi:aspartate aminotransferase-like enzyme